MKTSKNNSWPPTLADLTDDQAAQLAAYGAQHTLDSTTRWLNRKGVTTDPQTLAAFLSRHALKRHLEWCSVNVDLVVAAMRKREPSLSTEDLRKFGQRFFVEAAIAGKDPRAWAALEQAAARREKLDLDLQERRDELADQSDEGIPPELFEKIERELRLL